MHEGVWLKKNNWQNDSYENRQGFPYMAFVYAWITPTTAFDGAVLYFTYTM